MRVMRMRRRGRRVDVYKGGHRSNDQEPRLEYKQRWLLQNDVLIVGFLFQRLKP